MPTDDTQPVVAPSLLTVYDYLTKHVKMALAINEPGGAPNISLMHYAMHGTTRMLIGTRRSFKKFDLLKQNPNVSMLVPIESIDPLVSASIHGIAQELPSFEVESAYKLFKEENVSKWYVEGAEDFVMFSVEFTSVRWLDARSGELVITDIPMSRPPKI